MRQRFEWRDVAMLLTLLILAAAARYIAIGSTPGNEWDEWVYYAVDHNLLVHGLLETKNQILTPGEPYLYHPPFHFLLAAAFLKIVGDSFTSAREFAATYSMLSLVLLFVFLFFQLRQRRFAFVPLAFLALDAWLVYTNRIAWIDNDEVFWVVIAVMAYTMTMERPNRTWFLLAGLALGIAAVYKHVGAYVLVFAAIMYVLRPRKHHVGHLLMGAAAAIVILTYLLSMLGIFNQYYLAENFAQTARATSGTGETRGTINSLSQTITAFTHQYLIFWDMLVLAMAGIGVLVVESYLIGLTFLVRVGQWLGLEPNRFVVRKMQWFWGYSQFQHRPNQPGLRGIQDHLVLYAWCMAFGLFFGALSIKFPNYFVLGLTPIFCYTLSLAAKFLRLRVTAGSRLATLQRILMVVLVVLLLSNFVTYILRFVVPYGNPLVDSAHYLDAHVAPTQIVVTEESVGVITTAKYCKLDEIELCPAFSWIVVYYSNTQRPPNTLCVQRALLPRNSVKVASFYGFKEAKNVNGGVFVYRMRSSVSCRQLDAQTGSS